MLIVQLKCLHLESTDVASVFGSIQSAYYQQTDICVDLETEQLCAEQLRKKKECAHLYRKDRIFFAMYSKTCFIEVGTRRSENATYGISI